VNAKKQTWRDVLAVHPAADLFPMMSDVELDELGSDIAAHGLEHAIVLFTSNSHDDPVACDDECDTDSTVYLLDGRNRLEAMERKGIKIRYKLDPVCPSVVVEHHHRRGFGDQPSSSVLKLGWGDHDVGIVRRTDPYEYILSANVHRRHLTATQRREIVAKILKAQPEKSDRQIAKQTNVDHKTVGAQRTKLEATGEIPRSATRTGADGKTRKPSATKPTKAKPAARDLEVVKDPVPTEITRDPVPTEITKVKTSDKPITRGTKPQPTSRPADQQASGSLFASWVAAKAAGVEQTTRELATATPADVDDEAIKALEALAYASYQLTKAAGELAATHEEEQ
jgi:hypothetical protein